MLLTSLSACFRRAFPVLLTLLALAAGSAPLRASEAELKLPDLHQSFFINGSISGPALLMIGLGVCVLGFVFGSGTGLILGTVISQFRLLEATLRVYLVAIQALPKIALAPIIVMWFGFGLTSKVVIIALLTFFPLLVTSMAGFRAVEPDRLELMRALGANRWQMFWKVRLPSAFPYIFAGLDMAAVFSIVGAVVGEFVGAQRGLGTLILSMNAQMDTAGTFSVFIILSLLGIIMHTIMRVVEKRVLFWSGDQQRVSGN